MRLVLVVDDDPDIRMLVRLALGQHFDIAVARDGQDAIDVLASRGAEVAAMILDLQMPRKTGFEVLEHLQVTPALADIPVVVLTARTDRDAKLDVLVGGGQVFVAKPFDPDDLLATVTKLLSRSKSGRQADRLGRLMNLDE